MVSLERTAPFINLKCDPERAIEFREENVDIQPGYHMIQVKQELFYTAIANYGMFSN